ncbi:hypothetical protein [Psychromonas sp. SP041]|uniref:hypothetical protein n=1 Tax=Psychromonas sp. SP041 TaxID=1365007 RepID=UPI0010C7BD78|nr:hypothetical protein [Psychromonas sp. SP041]
MKYKFNKILSIGVASVLLGALILFFAISLSYANTWFLDLVVTKVSNGIDPLYFQNYANGLIAGGKISVFPFYGIVSLSLLGLIVMYYGTYVLVNSKRSTVLTDILQKEYWLEYQAKLEYQKNKPKKAKMSKKGVKPNKLNMSIKK